MASSSLFFTLESLFEENGAEQPLTLPTVMRGLEAWKPRSRTELPTRLEHLRGRLLEAARQTGVELQHDRDEELAGYLQEILVLLGELAGSLQATTLAVELSVNAKVHTERLRLQELLAQLDEWIEALREWKARPIPRCPRCGRAELSGSRCALCS